MADEKKLGERYVSVDPGLVPTTLITRPIRAGKSLEAAMFVQDALRRGETVFSMNPGGERVKIVDVDLSFDFPREPASGFPKLTTAFKLAPDDFPGLGLDRPDCVKALARMMAAVEEKRWEDLFLTAGYTSAQVVEAVRDPASAQDIIADINKAIKEALDDGRLAPPRFDDAYGFYRNVSVPYEPAPDRMKMLLMSAGYQVMHPRSMMSLVNVDVGPWDYLESPPRPLWTAPDPVERALRLVAARPLDRRRLKRVRRILGIAPWRSSQRRS